MDGGLTQRADSDPTQGPENSPPAYGQLIIYFIRISSYEDRGGGTDVYITDLTMDRRTCYGSCTYSDLIPATLYAWHSDLFSATRCRSPMTTVCTILQARSLYPTDIQHCRIHTCVSLLHLSYTERKGTLQGRHIM